jgi:hypothetical protein
VVDSGVKLANGRMFINCEKEETPDGFGSTSTAICGAAGA